MRKVKIHLLTEDQVPRMAEMEMAAWGPLGAGEDVIRHRLALGHTMIIASVENLVAGSVVFTPALEPIPLDDHYRWLIKKANGIPVEAIARERERQVAIGGRLAVDIGSPVVTVTASCPASIAVRTPVRARLAGRTLQT